MTGQPSEDFAMAFEVAEDDSFDLICPDCAAYLCFSAERPAPDEPGFYSNLSLGAVIEAVQAHKCEPEGDAS